MIKALIAVADGCEEIETIATYDLLKRAGIQTKMAALESQDAPVTGAHGLKFMADAALPDLFEDNYDLIVLPGGLPGSENLRDCDLLISMLKRQKRENRWIAAICAAPAYVLGTHGLADGAKITTYPGCEKLLGQAAIHVDAGVCVDSQAKIITAKGPGFANAFALAIIANLSGEQKMKDVAAAALIGG